MDPRNHLKNKFILWAMTVFQYLDMMGIHMLISTDEIVK